MRKIIGALFVLPVFIATLGFSIILALFKSEEFGFSWTLARVLWRQEFRKMEGAN